MAGIEIEKYASGHETSNQQSVICIISTRETCQSCDSYAAALAVEMWAQTGQKANTAWKNTCEPLAVQLQQWHPCEWQD